MSLALGSCVAAPTAPPPQIRRAVARAAPLLALNAHFRRASREARARALFDRAPRSSADRTAFARSVGPLLLENAAAAAGSELDALHTQVSAWRRRLTEAEWARLRVVVVGAHMARTGEVASQYFARLLGEEAEGNRWIFAESLFQEGQALDLL